MNRRRVYDIIQYSLLVAGQEDDFFDRDLGQIHIIKYVYLADLAYAQYNKGNTYTGIEWKFHNFGPWNTDLYSCIDPALEEIGATRRVIENLHDGGKDFVRYSLGSYDLFEAKERSLPLVISGHLQSAIHTYKKDTPALLDHVYKTLPMTMAAPGERLDFSSVVVEKPEQPAQELKWDALTIKKKKKFNAAMEAIRKKRDGRRKKAEASYIESPVQPLFDAVYEEGVEWLDNLEGEKIPEQEFEAHFSDEIWSSESRRGNFPD